jgi:hypothetical protein
MKIFKNSILALAAIALISFSSCNNDDANINIVEEGDPTTVAIRLSGVVNVRNAATGTTEEAGSTAAGTIKLDHAHVFVLNSAGDVLHQQNLPITGTTVLTEDGTTTPIEVLPTSRIYVVGNTPTAQRTALAALTSLDAIHKFTSAIETQDKYQHVVLANVNANPVTISNGVFTAGTAGSSDRYAVTVSINPVISRLELHQVIAKKTSSFNLEVKHLDENGGEIKTVQETLTGEIVGFNVTGIWVDYTYGNFTYEGGGEEGTLRFEDDDEKDPVVLAAMPVQITGVNRPAAPTGPAGNQVLAAKPETAGEVWAFNVASSSVNVLPLVPRLIVRIDNVKYKLDEDSDKKMEAAHGDDSWTLGVTHDFGKPSFITVTRYSDVTNGFVRGYIYQIDGTFEFGLGDLGIEVINPSEVEVEVGVRIQEWRAFPTTPSW